MQKLPFNHPHPKKIIFFLNVCTFITLYLALPLHQITKNKNKNYIRCEDISNTAAAFFLSSDCCYQSLSILSFFESCENCIFGVSFAI